MKKITLALFALFVVMLPCAALLSGCGNSQGAKDARAALVADSQQISEEFLQQAAQCAAKAVIADSTPTLARAESVAISCGLTAIFATVPDAVKVAWKWITDAIAQKKAQASESPPADPAAETPKGSTP